MTKQERERYGALVAEAVASFEGHVTFHPLAKQPGKAYLAICRMAADMTAWGDGTTLRQNLEFIAGEIQKAADFLDEQTAERCDCLLCGQMPHAL